MTLDACLRTYVSGYLLVDLRSMETFKLSARRRAWALGYPMVMSVAAGIELLGSLMSPTPTLSDCPRAGARAPCHVIEAPPLVATRHVEPSASALSTLGSSHHHRSQERGAERSCGSQSNHALTILVPRSLVHVEAMDRRPNEASKYCGTFRRFSIHYYLFLGLIGRERFSRG